MPCSRAFTTIETTTNEQQIMPNNVETPHKHMYLLYIDSLCNIAFLWHAYLNRDFTSVRENLNAIKHSIQLRLL